MDTGQIARDVREIELQLAAITGMVHAHDDHQANPGRREELDGWRATLAWILRHEPNSPMRMLDVAPDRDTLQSEFIEAGRVSLDVESPAAKYAGGAYEALRYYLGQRGPLVTVAERRK